MNASVMVIGLAFVFLLVDSSCGRSPPNENPARVPKKWQAAREQNANAAAQNLPGKYDEAVHATEPVHDDAPDKETADNSAQNKQSGEEPVQQPKTDGSNESSDDGYGAGSLCGYCSYCKFCKLCDKECPCETSEEKPNCHLCKYCKYCSLCSVCDSVCTPGGFIDMFTSSIYSSLPSIDKSTKEKVDKDIENARDFIKEYL